MTISRGELPDGNYTVVDNRYLRDPELSAKAKGLLAYMLSHHQSWRLSIDQMVREMADSRTSIDSGIKELEKRGYLQRQRQRGEGGRMGTYSYQIVSPEDDGHSGKPTVENPQWKTSTGADQAEQEQSAAQGQSMIPTVDNERSKKTTPTGEEKTTKKTERAERATRLPEGWTPGEKLMAWCLESEVPGKRWSAHTREFVRQQHQLFVDHWLATGKRYVDWDATWRNWMRRAFQRDYRAEGEPAKGKVFAQANDEYKDRKARAEKAHGVMVDQLMDGGMSFQEALKRADEAKRSFLAQEPLASGSPVPYIDGVSLAETPMEVTGS